MSRTNAIGVSAAAFLLVTGCGGPTPHAPPAPIGSVSDLEGNVYPTIVIGEQDWMITNLASTIYNDGAQIPNVTDAAAWANLTSDAYAWLDNDVANKDLYGAYYNWYAVDKRKLCPAGWAMPSRDSWSALVAALGGKAVAGGLMKEAGPAHWQAPNKGATNLSGFSALPAGERDLAGGFAVQGQYAEWWTSDFKLISLPGTAYFWDADYQGAESNGGEAEYPSGLSVRCFRAPPR